MYSLSTRLKIPRTYDQRLRNDQLQIELILFSSEINVSVRNWSFLVVMLTVNYETTKKCQELACHKGVKDEEEKEINLPL